MTELFPNINIAYGEIFLSFGALMLLMIGVFKNNSVNLVSWIAVGLIAVTLFLTVAAGSEQTYTFSNLFVADGFTRFMKVLVLLAAALAVIMSREFFRLEGDERFEFPILLVLATVGMMVMVSANDLMSLYMGIELQSLSLYVLAAFKRDSERSTEAGLKYFVLGALSSGILLYGCSLIYGFIGSTNFSSIAVALSNMGESGAPIGAIVGLVFVLSGLAFKISAVPFHMWTPDVYEGSQTPVTAFFAVAPKVAALALLSRTLYVPFGEMSGSWSQVVIFMSVASMLLGSFAAIMQTNIKRLMAYSAISNIGYIFLALSLGTQLGLEASLLYLTVYTVSALGGFAFILSMEKDNIMLNDIASFAGLSKSNPFYAICFSIILLSLAGLPPLAGFIAKFYIFKAVIAADYLWFAVIGIIGSVISAYYYLNIVKVMFLDEAEESFKVETKSSIKLILFITAMLLLIFLIYADSLVNFLTYISKAIVL